MIDLNSYGLKYVWGGKDVHGLGVQLHILQRDLPESVRVKSIGSLTFINLDIQGSQSDVSAPFVKTSLSFGLIDAPDKSTSIVKCGGWEEFFTPDATKYLVVLRRENPGGWFDDWRGYITPDSWKESLDYHGGITVVARDGLGFLQNMDFQYPSENIYGVKGISTILDESLSAINFPMEHIYPWDSTGQKDASHLVSPSGTYLIDAGVFLEHFSGEKVLDVLEKLLEAVGYCFRFIGFCKWVVVPIKNLPLFQQMQIVSVPKREIEFYGGERTLDPAFKEIIDKVSYEHEDEFDIPLDIAFNGSIVNYNGTYYDTVGQHGWRIFVGKERHGLTEKAWKKIAMWTGQGFFNGNQGVQRETLTNQEGEDYLKTSLLMSADRVDNDTTRYCEFWTNITEGELHIELGRPVELKTASSPWEFARLKNYIYTLEYQIQYTDTKTGTVYYWNAITGWLTSGPQPQTYAVATAMATEYEVKFNLPDISDAGGNPGGILRVYFLNWHTRGDDTPDNGSYVPIRKMTFSVKVPVLKSDTVRTVNNSNYNVVKERTLEVAPMSILKPYINGTSYENALWDKDSYSRLIPFSYNVFWSNEDSSKAIPMAGQIHKQLLCFNADPLSILEGDCFPVDKSYPYAFESILTYKGKKYILQAGTYDVLEGRLTGVILHEFIWYDDLWEETQSVNLGTLTEAQTNAIGLALRGTLDITEAEADSLLASGEDITLTKAQLAKISKAAEEASVEVEATTIDKATVAPSHSLLETSKWADADEAINENN